MMTLLQYLYFRTCVVAVSPEQVAMYPPSHLYKEIYDSDMHKAIRHSKLFFLVPPSAAPLGCSDGTLIRQNVTARQARPSCVADSLTVAA
jgi:hypothetical protein